ncbi:Glutathione S-transferase lancl1 [Halocaridina rubra]|uniref:Glutathione S-transferase lancl1 n=1 Tax=Halocaridina rubra TaxID=373956 RepID=A0AAN8XGF3_HALRR
MGDREERHIPNPFPKTLAADSIKVVDPSIGQLSADFVKNLQKSADSLLKKLEREIDSNIDWGDTSIYTGCCGYSLLYLHLADILGDDIYLQKAQPLMERCLKKMKGKRSSFLCGDAGPLAVAAVVFSKLNMKKEMANCIQGLKKLERDVLNPSSGLPDEILYGRAGYLYALLFLQREIGKDAVHDQTIHAVVEAILDSGRALARHEKSRSPLMYEWHEKKYIGAAHGIMGILFMLLQVKEYLNDKELQEKIKPTIDYMCSLQFPSGNMPSSLGNKTDRLIHWCHGAPGGVFLFAKAYEVFGNQSYLDQAKKCAECVWERGLLWKGYGLCHGTAGNGYALLYMYQVTKDTEYLYQAAQFARWCQDYGTHRCRTPDRPMSLFEGLAGTIYFLTDLTNPESAKFPAFVI